MYGETAVEKLRIVQHWGLSPHVRGNPTQRRYGGIPARSIPACTGKPGRHQRGGRPCGVYPRMYGETRRVWRRPDETHGLSPHVRGNHHRPLRAGGWQRSIPACTGKPVGGRRGTQTNQVYPRMYGETPGWCGMRAPTRGLSPHVRGNQTRIEAACKETGSIPACTGKPTRLSSRL